MRQKRYVFYQTYISHLNEIVEEIIKHVLNEYSIA